MQCIFEEETAYPGGRFSHSKCINRADILVINDPCYGLCYHCAYEKLEAENKQLAKFAREIIEEYCWNLCDPDGGSIQDLAKKLNLIKPHIATTEDVDDFSDFDVGDNICKFAPILHKP